MALDLPRWEIVERDRVAVGATATGLCGIGGDVAREWVSKFRCRQQGWLRRAARSRGMTVAPNAVAPVDDLVLRVEIRLDLDGHRRAEWCMRHFVFARPLHADRPAAGRPGQQNRVERDVVSGIVSVTAGAFH